MNTDLASPVAAPERNLDQTVFMGSGLDPAGRPGMTKVIFEEGPQAASRRTYGGIQSIATAGPFATLLGRRSKSSRGSVSRIMIAMK